MSDRARQTKRTPPNAPHTEAPAFTLNTERLRIRSPRVEDSPCLHELFSDPEAMRYMPRGASPSLEETEARVREFMRIESRTGTTLFAVERTDDSGLIGVAGVFPYELVGPELELGFAIMRRHWGAGYATEAARALAAWAFSPSGCDENRLWAVAYDGNAPSERVLEKVGFQREEPVMHRGRRGIRFYALRPDHDSMKDTVR